MSASLKRRLTHVLGKDLLNIGLKSRTDVGRRLLITNLAKDPKVTSAFNEMLGLIAESCPISRNYYPKDMPIGDLKFLLNNWATVGTDKRGMITAFLEAMLSSEAFQSIGGSREMTESRIRSEYGMVRRTAFTERKPSHAGESYIGQPTPSDTFIRHESQKTGSALITSNLDRSNGRGQIEPSVHPDALMMGQSLPIAVSIRDVMSDISSAEPTARMDLPTNIMAPTSDQDKAQIAAHPTQHTSGYIKRPQIIGIKRKAMVSEGGTDEDSRAVNNPMPETKKSRTESLTTAMTSVGESNSGNNSVEGYKGTNVTAMMSVGMGTGGFELPGSTPGVPSMPGKTTTSIPIVSPIISPVDSKYSMRRYSRASLSPKSADPSVSAGLISDFFSHLTPEVKETKEDEKSIGIDIPDPESTLKSVISRFKGRSDIDFGSMWLQEFTAASESFDSLMFGDEPNDFQAYLIQHSKNRALMNAYNDMPKGSHSGDLPFDPKYDADYLRDIKEVNDTELKSLLTAFRGKIPKGTAAKDRLHKRLIAWRVKYDKASAPLKRKVAEIASPVASSSSSSSSSASTRTSGRITPPVASGRLTPPATGVVTRSRSGSTTVPTPVPGKKSVGLLHNASRMNESKSLDPSSFNESESSANTSAISKMLNGETEANIGDLIKAAASWAAQQAVVYGLDNIQSAFSSTSNYLATAMHAVRGWVMGHESKDTSNGIKDLTNALDNNDPSKPTTVTFSPHDLNGLASSDIIDFLAKLKDSKISEQYKKELVISAVKLLDPNRSHSRATDILAFENKAVKNLGGSIPMRANLGAGYTNGTWNAISHEGLTTRDAKGGTRTSPVQGIPEAKTGVPSRQELDQYAHTSSSIRGANDVFDSRLRDLAIEAVSSTHTTQPSTAEASLVEEKNPPGAPSEDKKIDFGGGSAPSTPTSTSLPHLIIPDEDEDKSGIRAPDATTPEPPDVEPDEKAALDGKTEEVPEPKKTWNEDTNIPDTQTAGFLRPSFATGGANIVWRQNENKVQQTINQLTWQTLDDYDWEANEETNNPLYMMNIVEESRRFFGELDKDSMLPMQAEQALEYTNDASSLPLTIPDEIKRDGDCLVLDTRGGPLEPLNSDATYEEFHNVFLPCWYHVPEDSGFAQFTQIEGTAIPDTMLHNVNQYAGNDWPRFKMTNSFISNTLM